MKRRTANRAGFILFSVLCVFLILAAIIGPLIAWSVSEFSWTTRSFKSLRALNLADAGAELAIWEIAYNDAQFTGWSGANPKTITISSFTDNLGETMGDITVSAEETSPDHYFVISSGVVPVADGSITKRVKVKAFPHPLFNNSLFGSQSLTLTGNTMIDSYNSNLAPYDPLTAGQEGDVGTNGTLTLSENASVNGDIFIGPYGSVVGDIATHVTGEDYYWGNEVELEDVPFDSDYFTSLPSQGDFALGGKDMLTIPSGDYRYESITVDAKSSLTISSSTRLYVSNYFYIGGQAKVFTNEEVELYLGGDGNFAGQGIINTSGIPGNLIIYGVGDDTNLNFTGQNDFYGTVYAPTSSIYMAGDADYYGSAIGENVELAGNIKFHFDEALLTDGPMVGYDIAYWQED